MRKLIFALTLAFAISATFISWDGFSAAARAGAATALQPVVIDFENLPPGALSNQYAHLGVTFNNMTVATYPHLPGFTHSGVSAGEQCYGQEFCTLPIELRFTSAQRRVKLWAGLSSAFGASTTVIMRALDAGGAQVGQATTVFNASSAPQPIQQPLEIALPNAAIRRVLVTFAGSTATNFLAIDDLEFDSAGPPPACPITEDTTMNLIQPVNGQTAQFNAFTLEAFIASQDPLANHFTLTVNGPGGATRTSVHSLASGKFGPTTMNGYLFPGLNTVIVKFQDCQGTVQASRSVTYTPIPAGTRFELLSIEVTQATQDARNGVPLVANKKALARVYLRVQPPPGQSALIRDVSGQLVAQRRSGTGLGNFLPGIVRPLNTITATAALGLGTRRLNFAASLNFELPAQWTTAGDLHLSFRPDIKDSPISPSSLPCTNCDNGNPLNPALPLFVKFEPTRRLNLILAPYIYQPSGAPPVPLSAELLFTPAGALQWVNNVFPLPGNFPSDGSGINLLRILPTRTTHHNLRPNDSSQDAFLFQLKLVLASLHIQGGLPSDTRLLAMVPCGCGGAASGNVAFVDTWASEKPDPVSPKLHFQSYGATWAHELGHTFGREHAGNWHGEDDGGDVDGNFPHFHGGIGQPGVALTTEWWQPGGTPYFIAPGAAIPNALGPHAHDFMSYGHTDAPLNTGFWVSPYTYSALFNKFKLSTRQVVQPGINPTLAERARPVEKLVALGQINADGTVDLQPFYRARTAFRSGDGSAGEFSLVLLDAEDQVLIEHRFDAEAIAHSKAGTLGFTEFVPWQPGTQRIVLKRKDTMLAERRVSQHAPTVRVLSPNGGEWLGNEATITWAASDPDGDPLSYTVLYNTGTDGSWWPIATGVTTTSISVDTSLWPGSTQGRVMVRVTDGVHTAEDVADNAFTVPQKSPLVAILNAEADNGRGQEAPTQLTAFAYDPEDGLLSEANILWTSDRDGQLESGRQVNVESLSPGNHVLTLIVTDSQGQTATTQVTKHVRRTPDKQPR